MEIAATEFAPSYRQATVMQASLAAVGLVSSIAAWLAGASFLWVVGGVLLGSVIPFTLIVIPPTYKQLLSPTLDKRSAETERLLARWGMLHAVRSVAQRIGTSAVLVLGDLRKTALISVGRGPSSGQMAWSRKKIVRRNRRPLFGSRGNSGAT